LKVEKPVRFILAESSLETIPRELFGHPAVVKTARRRKKPAGSIILDRSLHHHAMRRLAHAEKRGRPDIVQFVLLEVLGSPLNRRGLLEVFVHTITSKVIYVDPSTRLPRNYNRFIGLMEQVFERGQVPPGSEKPLIKIVDVKLEELVKDSYTILFWEKGERKRIMDVAKEIVNLMQRERIVLMIGGFPHGDFSETVLSLANEKISIGSGEVLDAWIVASRVLSAIEIELGIV